MLGVLVEYCTDWRVLYCMFFRMRVRVQVETMEEGINIRYPVSRNKHRPLDSVLYAGCSMRAGAVGELPYWSAAVHFSISSCPPFRIVPRVGGRGPAERSAGKSLLVCSSAPTSLYSHNCNSPATVLSISWIGCRLHGGHGTWSLLPSWWCSAFRDGGTSDSPKVEVRRMIVASRYAKLS